MAGAGDFSARFRFERRSVLPEGDGAGNFEADWLVEHGPVSAKRIFLVGSEAVQAARLEGRKPALITIRNCRAASAIDTNCRAVDERSGQIFNIRSATLTANRAYIEILCESGVAA